jgi:hypothetical protein
MTRWTLRSIDLGHWRLELVHTRVPVALEWFEGGGYAASYAAWRVCGRLAVVIEAALT